MAKSSNKKSGASNKATQAAKSAVKPAKEAVKPTTKTVKSKKKKKNDNDFLVRKGSIDLTVVDSPKHIKAPGVL